MWLRKKTIDESSWKYFLITGFVSLRVLIFLIKYIIFRKGTKKIRKTPVPPEGNEKSPAQIIKEIRENGGIEPSELFVLYWLSE